MVRPGGDTGMSTPVHALVVVETKDRMVEIVEWKIGLGESATIPGCSDCTFCPVLLVLVLIIDTI